MKKMQPRAMSIVEIDGGFGWHVSFSNDPRLPRAGQAPTFGKALSAVRRAIRTANDGGPIPTVDNRPPPS